LAEDTVNIRHDIPAIDPDGTVGAIPKGNMKNGPIFGDIDPVAVKHGIASSFEIARAGELEEQGEGFVSNPVFRVVKEPTSGFDGKAVGTARIIREELPEMEGCNRTVVGFECFPLG
jgi:hypothetical protein